MAIFVPRFLRQLRDVLIAAPADTEVLTYDIADGKWKNLPAGGGGGLTFAQILAALAAIGVTIDPASGAVTLEPTGDVNSLHLIPPAFTGNDSYVPLRIERPGGSASYNQDLFDVEMDGTFWITPPGEGDDYYLSLKGNVRQSRIYTGAIADHALQRIFNWGAADPDSGKMSFFHGTAVVVQQTAASISDLWAALQAYGLLDGGSVAPSAGGAPTTATYITQTPDAGLSAEQALSALATGLVKNTTGTGVLSIGAQGTDYWAPGGTDVALADGGTGSSTAVGALTNLGVSAFIQTLLDDADAVTARATLGVLAALFQDGGAQELSVTGLAGLLADAQKITVRKNTGADVGTRKRVNFIEGTNVTLTVADDAGGDEVDVTIASSGGGGATALDGLTDAAVASPVAGQGLAYDGTDFVNIRQPQLVDAFTPAGGLAQTCSRVAAASTITLVSLRLDLYGIWLPKGLLITSITFLSQATALSVGVNQLFGIFDDNSGSSSGTARALLRGSVDGTSGAWAANAFKTLALTSTYTTTRAGLHYLGILVNATTPPNLDAVAIGTTAIAGLTPIVGGTSTTTITALPNPAGAISANGRLAHAYVS